MILHEIPFLSYASTNTQEYPEDLKQHATMSTLKRVWISSGGMFLDPVFMHR